MTEPASATEAMTRTLHEKKLSNKINYIALEDLHDYTPSRTIPTFSPAPSILKTQNVRYDNISCFFIVVWVSLALFGVQYMGVDFNLYEISATFMAF